MFFLRLMILVLLLASCSEPTLESPPLKLGLVVWLGFGPAFIAQEKNLFEKHGVKVDIISKPDLSQIVQSYRNGELDGLFHGFTEAITLNADGFDPQLIHVIDYSKSGDVLIGHPAIRGINELKNKTVSFEGVNSFSHLFVVKLLEKHGIREYEFHAKNIQASQVLAALEAGEIDAGHIWEPMKSQALEKGYKILGQSDELPGFITDTLLLSKKVVQKHPEDVKRVIRALLDAKDFMETHEEEGLTILAKTLSVSKAEVKTGLEGIHLLSLKENVDIMQPGSSLFTSGQEIARFLSDKGLIVKSPDLNSIINKQFIQEISNE